MKMNEKSEFYKQHESIERQGFNDHQQQAAFYEQIGVAMTCRSYDEYERMFSFQSADLQQGAILDIAAGASSFTAGARARGLQAVAVDPMYSLSPKEMETYALKEIEHATQKLATLTLRFNWEYYGSIEQHMANRLQSLKVFMQDYNLDETKKIYFPCSLPQLPFEDDTFSRVFCSHFLFLYADQFDYSFHLQAISEMIRVCRPAGEIRIYPLLDLKHRPYAYLDELQSSLQKQGVRLNLLKSELRFIPASTHMLSITKL